MLAPAAGPVSKSMLEHHAAALDSDERYSDLGEAGSGGMGEVRWLFDRDLNRVVAMKTMHPDLMEVAGLSDSFLAEARITAQLSHPGVVPVHELGTLPDGRPYFTMKGIDGETLGDLAERHRQGDPAVTAASLVDVVRRACEAVAYAHSRGVVHRDLKPENILISQFGAVIVLDWGLAAQFTDPNNAHGGDGNEQVKRGGISGTPGYIAPELLRDGLSMLTPRCDVFSLGVTLLHALNGSPPFGDDPQEAIHRTLLDPITIERIGTLVPAGLRAHCAAAVQMDPDLRPADAGEFGGALTNWLHGVDQELRANEALRGAETHDQRARELRDRAVEVATQSYLLRDRIDPGAGPADKGELWLLEDEAAKLEEEAEIESALAVQFAQAGLSFVPDFPDARRLLADHYQQAHHRALEARDKAAATQAEVLLRAYDDGRWLSYLSGEGRFQVLTNPPGASVSIYRLEERERQLEPVPVHEASSTPTEFALPSGSYVAEIKSAGRTLVRYPIVIEGGRDWDRTRPEGDSHPIRLPAEGVIGPDDAFVPAGWFRCGGDPFAEGSPLPAQQVWLDDFVIRACPVTNAEYLAFLNDLVAQDREPEAIAACPQERTSSASVEPILVLGRDAQGAFHYQPDADGDTWRNEEPVRQVDWFGATAFAAWLCEREGVPWRLPNEFEWEKAARGVDRRVYPWGSRFDASFCVMRDSHQGEFYVRSVGHARDVSPYGVRDMAGGVNEWCSDPYSARGANVIEGRPQIESVPGDVPFRVIRGGGWTDSEGRCRTAWREGPPVTYRMHSLGFRIARSV